MRRIARFCLALSCLMMAALPTLGGSPIPPPQPPPVLPPVGTPGPTFVPPIPVPVPTVTPAYTQQIARQLNEVQRFCRRVPASEYTIDCIRDQLDQIVSDMPTSGDYAEARAAISDAANKLRGLVRENASRDLPSGRIGTADGSQRSGSALVPVRTDQLARVNNAALEILQETETILLRSAANSASRRTHYQTIAQAFGSNKVLLRS